MQVLCQYLKVWEIARDTVLDQTRSDRFVWKWSADGKYSASSTYRAFFAGSTVLLGARELWKTRAPPKVKFFRWLAFHGRLWTADRRRRHGLQDCDACVLCGQASETVEHLFLGCVLARQVWYLLLSPLGLASLTPDADVRFGHWWIRQRKRLDAPAQQLFDSMILLVAWVLWKERNSVTFERSLVSDATSICRKVASEANEWALAGFRSVSAAVSAWSLFLFTI